MLPAVWTFPLLFGGLSSAEWVPSLQTGSGTLTLEVCSSSTLFFSILKDRPVLPFEGLQQATEEQFERAPG